MDPNQWYYVNFVTQLLDMNGSQTGCREISEGAVGVKPSGGGIGVVEGGDAVMLSRSVFFFSTHALPVDVLMRQLELWKRQLSVRKRWYVQVFEQLFFATVLSTTQPYLSLNTQIFS